ncbi:TPA: cytochrome c biogenesis protein CcdA [Candidatus Poribacteria bacterium]|nr:cytochrome c biogenesis protein CcdA [Candidatus Poribacteria bacterium]
MPQTENVSLIIAFLAGLGYFLSPCVLPLVPSYISYVTGISIENLREHGGRKKVQWAGMIHSLLFILGFSIVFITLGASASFAGQILARHLDIVRIVGGVLIILIGLFIIGLLKITFLMRDRRWFMRRKPTDYLGSVLVGISFSAGWTACSTPVLSAILIYTSMGKTIGTGIILLAFFSLGLATPFFLTSLAMNTFLSLFDKVKKYLRVIEIVSGILLIIFGILILTNYFSILSQKLVEWTGWQGI